MPCEAILCIGAAKLLTASGLALTLVGSILLFFYGLPVKKIGTVIVWGIQAMNVAGRGEKATPPEVWQPAASAFQKRALVLNRIGFGLVAVGTAMQIVGVFL